MPGYFNGTMKKIEEFRKQVRFFSEDIDSLPLPSEILNKANSIFVFPQNYFTELSSKLGADKRISEANEAIVDAVKHINYLLSNITEFRNELDPM